MINKFYWRKLVQKINLSIKEKKKEEEMKQNVIWAKNSRLSVNECINWKECEELEELLWRIERKTLTIWEYSSHFKIRSCETNNWCFV